MLQNKVNSDTCDTVQNTRVKLEVDDRLGDKRNFVCDNQSEKDILGSLKNMPASNNSQVQNDMLLHHRQQNGQILNIPTMKNRHLHSLPTKVIKRNREICKKGEDYNSDYLSCERRQSLNVLHSPSNGYGKLIGSCPINGAEFNRKSNLESYKSKRKCYTPRRRQKDADEVQLVEKEVKRYLLKIPDIQSIIENSVSDDTPKFIPSQSLTSNDRSRLELEDSNSCVKNIKEEKEDLLTHDEEEVEEVINKDMKELNENEEMEHDGISPTKKKTWKPKERVACDMCDKTFGRPSDLRRHKVLHTGEKNHKCEECQKVFAQRYHLIRHVKNVHKKEIENLVCGMCNETFNSEYLLLRHVKRHGVMTFACEICRKKFKTKRQMMEHILSQHVGMKPFKCDQCDKVFSRKYHLERHVVIHTGIKDYQCEYCGKEFGTKGNLLAHVKRVHLKIKEFSCGICQKGFFSPKDLQTHFKTHTGEKPYECEVCQKKFTEKVNMEWHMRIHSGERPFQCENCLKSYTRMPHLVRHKKEGLCRRRQRIPRVAAIYFYKWWNKTKTSKRRLGLEHENSEYDRQLVTKNENINETDMDFEIENDEELDKDNYPNKNETDFHPYLIGTSDEFNETLCT